VLLVHVSFNLEFTLCIYINILWAWDQILSLSVKMKRSWRTQNCSYWQRISEISCSFVYSLLVMNNSKCKIIQPLQPVQKAESVLFSALGITWNPPGDPGKAHSTLTFSFVLFFSSHCPAYMNSEGHTILLPFPPVMKYTGAKVLLKNSVTNALLTHYSCSSHTNWLYALCCFTLNTLYL